MSNGETTVKLSYAAAQFKVKLELSKSICSQASQPPTDLVKRAKTKMDAIKDNNEIEFYILYYEKLKNFWKTLANDPDVAPDQKFYFTLAEGCPPLRGVKVDLAQNGKTLVQLTITATANDVKSWRFEWIELMINHTLRNAGIEETINTSQVHGSWLRAALGEPVKEVPLSGKPPLGTPQEVQEKPYMVVGNKARQEIAFIVKNLRLVYQSLTPSEVVKIVKDASDKIAAQFGGDYQILKKEIATAIQNAATGSEYFGIDLPLMILGASTANINLLVKSSGSMDYPGAGKLNVRISKGGLQASVVDFDTKIYKDSSFSKDEEWIRKELKRQGISEKASALYVKDLLALLDEGVTLEGVTAAEGTPAVAGTGPYLCAVYQETAVAQSKESGNVDLRSLQQRNIVKVGQVIAEIRHKTPSVIGMDVFGSPIEATDSEPLLVSVGEGVKVKGQGKYYAIIAGIPVVDVEKNKIEVSQKMTHNGDVNLRTGDIVFNGPVEIKGSVDSGARVEAKGDVIITGSIRGGFVKSGGSIIVKVGITTGKTGYVSAKDNVEAEFIENSKIECAGNLIVKKVLINSEVICGGGINMTDISTGVLAGGDVACRLNITTAHLGFKNGAITKLNVGVDWKIERKVRLRRKRLERVIQIQTNDRQALRELLSRKNQEKSSKTQEKKDLYQKKLQKARVIIENIEKRLAEVEQQLLYNPQSKVFVSGTLYANCSIQIGGGPVLIPQDMAGVAVLAKRKHGSKIVSIEVGRKVDEEENENE